MSSRDRAGRGETINIPALRSVIAALLDRIEEQEGADPQLGPGYFWDVVAEDRYDVHNQSPQLSIGDLDETRDWLESACQEDSAPMPRYALAWAGDVLKALAVAGPY